MSGPSAVKETPIESRDQLLEYMGSGVRTPDQWKIGTEHEKFGFRLDDLRPPTYEGDRGIGKMLEGLMRFGWAPVREGDNIIALTARRWFDHAGTRRAIGIIRRPARYDPRDVRGS